MEKVKAQLYESLAGRAAIANARLAYRLFNEVFNSQRFLSLKANGARLQRPLWASTSTKNPAYRDVLYVEELIAPDTINTRFLLPRLTPFGTWLSGRENI